MCKSEWNATQYIIVSKRRSGIDFTTGPYAYNPSLVKIHFALTWKLMTRLGHNFTCHDSPDVATCVKSWPVLVIRMMIKRNGIFTRFRQRAHYPFVNWPPGHSSRMDTPGSNAFNEVWLEHHSSHFVPCIWYRSLQCQIANWHRPWQSMCSLIVLTRHWNWNVLFTKFFLLASPKVFRISSFQLSKRKSMSISI